VVLAHHRRRRLGRALFYLGFVLTISGVVAVPFVPVVGLLIAPGVLAVNYGLNLWIFGTMRLPRYLRDILHRHR
jgi:hypothetical protein